MGKQLLLLKLICISFLRIFLICVFWSSPDQKMNGNPTVDPSSQQNGTALLSGLPVTKRLCFSVPNSFIIDFKEVSPVLWFPNALGPEPWASPVGLRSQRSCLPG